MADKMQTTMSVRNMGRLLGLKKVESYWLVHKNYFETVTIAGKMRVVISSFEDWYAHQVKYQKVSGEPPGEKLKQESYSVRDIAEMLGLCEARAYEVMNASGLQPIFVNFWKRYPKEDFERWYSEQSHYRKKEERERDAELESSSMSMPEMARLLDVPRSIVYSILRTDPGKSQLEVVIVGDQKRIMKDSFKRWYSKQTLYLKPEDRPGHPDALDLHYEDCLNARHIKYQRQRKQAAMDNPSANPDFLTKQEAAYLADTAMRTIERWIRENNFPVAKISSKLVRIPKKDFLQFLESKQTEKNERS